MSVTAADGESVAPDGDGETAVSREETFDLLSNQRRRHTMHYLRQEERPVELRELSTQVSAWETGTDPEAITHDQRKRVYTALRQSHLPKMDEAGVVDYDASRGVIEPTDAMDDVEVYLDVVPANEIPRSEYYLGLSAVSAALLVVAGVGIFPFGEVPLGVWAGVVVGLFAVSSAVDTYHDRKHRLGSEGPPPESDSAGE